MINQFFTYLTGNIDTVVVLIIAIVLGWDKYVSGSSSLRKEIAADYKERNSQLEGKLKENTDAITATNLEVARLSGVIQEKDKHIESLTKILQDKNPETLNLLREIKEGNAVVHKFMEQVYDFMKKSNEELGYQTEILEKSQERNTKIDKASKLHVGDIVRIPKNGKSKVVKSK